MYTRYVCECVRACVWMYALENIYIRHSYLHLQNELRQVWIYFYWVLKPSNPYGFTKWIQALDTLNFEFSFGRSESLGVFSKWPVDDFECVTSVLSQRVQKSKSIHTYWDKQSEMVWKEQDNQNEAQWEQSGREIETKKKVNQMWESEYRKWAEKQMDCIFGVMASTYVRQRNSCTRVTV